MKTLFGSPLRCARTSRAVVLSSVCLFIALACSSCFLNFNSFDVISGNGNVITRERQIAAFSKIENATQADIDITTKGTQKVELRTDENLHEYFITEVTGGKLRIYTRSGTNISTVRGVRFTISMPSLEEVSNSGSGDITVSPLESSTFALTNSGSGDVNLSKIKGETFTLTNNGSGDIDLKELVVQSLTARLNGSGSLTAQGTANTGKLETFGSGDIRARNTTFQEATAQTSGSGGITLSVVQKLDATTRGSGDITYYGNPPNITRTTTGSGRVSRGN